MKKRFTILIFTLALIFISGCSQSIEEVKKDENIGEKVTVRGTVEGTVKIGEISGYTLVDENGDKIGVASKSLPAEGEKITVKGTLVKKPILGYYIDVDN